MSDNPDWLKWREELEKLAIRRHLASRLLEDDAWRFYYD